MSQRGIYQGLCVALALFFSLLAPALVNGHAFMFADSLGYYRTGEAAIETLKEQVGAGAARVAPEAGERSVAEDQEGDGVRTDRSVYYGLPAFLANRVGGEWLWPSLQILLSGVSLLLIGRRLPFLPWPTRTLIYALAVTVSGLGIFATTIMPDLFAGLLIAGMTLCVVEWRTMSPLERSFWLTLIAYSCLTHKGHLVLAGGFLMVAGLVAWRERLSARPIAWIGVLAAVAAFGHMMIGIAVERVTGRPPVETPFLLARLIGDGTAVSYLREACPAKPYAMCRHLDRLPVAEVDFLWSTDPRVGFENVLSNDELARIHAEAGDIVKGTLQSHPIEQAGITLSNILSQFVFVGATRFGRSAGLGSEHASTPAIRQITDRYADSQVMRNRLPLTDWSKTMSVAYLLSLAALIVLAFRPGTPALSRPTQIMIVLLIVGLFVNSAVSGTFSAVVDRYQGRVAWIPVFLAIYLVAARFTSQASRKASDQSALTLP